MCPKLSRKMTLRPAKQLAFKFYATFQKTKSGLKMHDISGTLYQNFVQIGPHSSEISFLIWESFCYFSIIITLKLYNFYMVQDRGIQSVHEMLCMKRALQTCIVRSGSPPLVSPMSSNMLHFLIFLHKFQIQGLITLKRFKIEAHCQKMKC